MTAKIVTFAAALAALLLNVAGAGAAGSSQGPVVQAPPDIARAFDWNGVYFGVQGGAEWHQDAIADPALGIGSSAAFLGALAGAHIGFDVQRDRYVIGVVGDFDWAGNASGTTPGFGCCLDTYGKATAKWQASVRGRFGVAFGNTLPYATAGVAFGNYDMDYAWPGPAFGIGDQFNSTLIGYTVGGGVSMALKGNANIWLEYRYTDYAGVSSGIANCCLGPPNTQTHDITTHGLRAGLSLRFR